MMDKWVPVGTIARELGLTRQRVTQIIEEAKDRGVTIPTKQRKVEVYRVRKQSVKHIDFDAFKRYRNIREAKKK